MTVGPITQCLTFWLRLQNSGVQAFRFHSVWNEVEGVYVEAMEQRGMSGMIQDTAKEAERVKFDKGKGRVRSSNKKHSRERGNIEKKKNIERPDRRKVAHRPPKVSSPEQHGRNAPLTTRGEVTAHGDYPRNTWVDAEPIGAGQELWPIDPTLPSYPTQGPNDPVPSGYKPVPMSFLPTTFGQQEQPQPQPTSTELQQPEWLMHIMERLGTLEDTIRRPPAARTLLHFPPATTVIPNAGSLPPPKTPDQINPPAIPDPFTACPGPNMPERHLDPTGIIYPPASSTLPPLQSAPYAGELPPPNAENITAALNHMPAENKPILASISAEPVRPRTWPTKVTPRQTRQKAKERGMTVSPIKDPMGKTQKSSTKQETSPGRSEPHQTRQHGKGRAKVDMVPTKEKSEDEESVQPAKPSRKRGAPTAAGSASPHKKRVKVENSSSTEPMEHLPPRPRPLRRGTRTVNLDESDRFNLRSRVVTRGHQR